MGRRCLATGEGARLAVARLAVAPLDAAPPDAAPLAEGDDWFHEVTAGCRGADVGRPLPTRSGRTWNGSAYMTKATAAITASRRKEAAARAREDRSVLPGPGCPNVVSRAASAGSARARWCSISARIRCSSMESAMAPPPPSMPMLIATTIPQPQDF